MKISRIWYWKFFVNLTKLPQNPNDEISRIFTKFAYFSIKLDYWGRKLCFYRNQLKVANLLQKAYGMMVFLNVVFFSNRIEGFMAKNLKILKFERIRKKIYWRKSIPQKKRFILLKNIFKPANGCLFRSTCVFLVVSFTTRRSWAVGQTPLETGQKIFFGVMLNDDSHVCLVNRSIRFRILSCHCFAFGIFRFPNFGVFQLREMFLL